MRISAIFIATLLIAVAGIPLGQAADGWKHRGTNEPDTYEDVIDGYMYDAPDTNPSDMVRKVYFNGYRTQAEVSYNPNVAALGSRVQWFGETQFVALLGFWKDCNGDGYVGSSEYGLQEYRAELLLDDSVCKSTTPPSCAGGCPVGYIYPHNDGTWVRELTWIGSKAGPKGGPISANPTYYAAKDTAVWGTFGRPGDAPGTVCPITGNFQTHSTGSLLEYGDCFTGYMVTTELNKAQDDTGLPVGGWNVGKVDHSDDAFLNISNPAHPALYGNSPQGGAGDGHNGGLLARDDHSTGSKQERAYGVFDCNSAGTVVNDPTGGTLSGRQGVTAPVVDDPTTSGDDNLLRSVTTNDGFLLQSVSVFDASGKRELVTPGPSVRTSGSLYEGANETYNVATTGECYPTDHPAPYPYFEGETTSTNAFAGRNKADLNFIFSAGARQNVATDVMGKNWPADLGLAPNRELDTVGSSWRENRNFLTLPQLVNRADLTLSEAQYMTFYARLGPDAALASLSTPTNGAQSTFGAENCEVIAPGAANQNGWACDRAVWLDACDDGGLGTAPCAVVGDLYDLRDIDCEDGAIVRDVDVFVSGSMVTGGCIGPNGPGA